MNTEGITEIEMDEDEFIDRYEPETDEDGNIYVQREPYDPNDWAFCQKAAQENRCWTMLDVDGHLFLSEGIHIINRLYYIVTKQSYPPNTFITVIMD